MIVQSYRTKKFHSQMPFIGGFLGASGMGLLPVDAVSRLWWIPPLIDPGCVLLFSLTAVSFLFHRRRFISNTDNVVQSSNNAKRKT